MAITAWLARTVVITCLIVACGGPAPATANGQRLYNANELIGQRVKNEEGDSLGLLKTLVISPSGKVVYGVLGQSLGPSMTGKSYLVPWGRLEIGSHNEVKVKVPRDDLDKQFSTMGPSQSPR